MVTTAAWSDMDGDHYPELLLAGDWMPVMLFGNQQGRLSDISLKSGLSHLTGMWSSITPLPSGQGFVLGNGGYNSQFKASVAQPMTICAADFDGNGSIDPIICYYIKGKSYPMASRDELLDQINVLKKKYIHYNDYADAALGDIFSKEKIAGAKMLTCEELATGILRANGTGQYIFKPMPPVAQFSRVSGAIIDDLDRDGIADLVIAGNFFSFRTQLGACDASLGLFLKGRSDGTYDPIDPAASGLYAGGDVRKIVEIITASGEKLLIVAKNDDAVQVIKVNTK
jgi:hypothetical protein